MKLDITLLGVLAATPMTGYELKKWLSVEGQFNGLDRHSSQIYRELVRMETTGWLVHRVELRQGGADAKVYRVTDAGMEVLKNWIYSAYYPNALVTNPDFDFRIKFSAMLDRRRCVEIFEQELAYREEQVRINRDRNRSLRSEDPRPEVSLTDLKIAEDLEHFFGAEMADQRIEWLRAQIDRLKGAGWAR